MFLRLVSVCQGPSGVPGLPLENQCVTQHCKDAAAAAAAARPPWSVSTVLHQAAPHCATVRAREEGRDERQSSHSSGNMASCEASEGEIAPVWRQQQQQRQLLVLCLDVAAEAAPQHEASVPQPISLTRETIDSGICEGRGEARKEAEGGGGAPGCCDPPSPSSFFPPFLPPPLLFLPVYTEPSSWRNKQKGVQS